MDHAPCAGPWQLGVKPLPCVVPGVGFPTSLRFGRIFSPRNHILWECLSFPPVDRAKGHLAAQPTQLCKLLPTAQKGQVGVIPLLLTAPSKASLSPLSLAGFSAPNWTLRPQGMPNQSQHLLPPPAGGHWVLYFTDTVAPFPGELPMESALSLVLFLCPDDDDDDNDDDFYFLSFLLLSLLSCGHFFSPPSPFPGFPHWSWMAL
ncbi:hypothetical protein EK904_012021 [Melospiza melodia maxima]|nr:hypothetical protein EK904_012021 [Melospiza melodia maxima]